MASPPLLERATCAGIALAVATLLLFATGCQTTRREKSIYAYPAEAFRAEVVSRVPDIPPALAEAPFVLDEAIVERARRLMDDAPRGPERVQILVDFLGKPEPEGLGLVYDWSATGSARLTIERRRGNCVSLANVLIGLGRQLGWPIYYAEVRARHPDTHEFESIRAVSDHMAVLVAARSVQMIVDFTGLIEEVYSVQPIDDVKAYAHVLNNMSSRPVLISQGAPSPEAWEQALRGFQLATRVDPSLGRAWNNLGIALTRLGRFEQAREAYRRAVSLDTAFGSAERNLSVMETRAQGEARIVEQPVAR